MAPKQQIKTIALVIMFKIDFGISDHVQWRAFIETFRTAQKIARSSATFSVKRSKSGFKVFGGGQIGAFFIFSGLLCLVITASAPAVCLVVTK